jgi:hypothetical protein
MQAIEAISHINLDEVDRTKQGIGKEHFCKDTI